jgi:hypothetical protein
LQKKLSVFSPKNGENIFKIITPVPVCHFILYSSSQVEEVGKSLIGFSAQDERGPVTIKLESMTTSSVRLKKVLVTLFNCLQGDQILLKKSPKT